MRVHQSWVSEGFDLPPMTDATSVFTGREFLAAWWEHFGDGELALVEADDALVPLWHGPDGTVRFVGDEDLTDYHSPLGAGAGPLLAAYLGQQPPGTHFRFDSLPLEAASTLAGSLGGVEPFEHEARDGRDPVVDPTADLCTGIDSNVVEANRCHHARSSENGLFPLHVLALRHKASTPMPVHCGGHVPSWCVVVS